MSKKKRSRKPLKTSLRSQKLLKTSIVDKEQPSSDCYEGYRLDDLLRKLKGSIKAAKVSEGGLPEKIWTKQQFAIGVNDVTRVLERMPPADVGLHSGEDLAKEVPQRVSSVRLQAVLIASDCNPRLLTKHLPVLASSRKVPVILVKDNKRGSLRLGELVMLKTAMSIGVKARGSRINDAIDEILASNCTRG